MDAICKFNKLDNLAMRKIVSKFINELNNNLVDKHFRIRLTEAAVDHLIAEGFDSKMGARPLARKIDQLIKVPLSKKILFEEITNGSTVIVDYNNDQIEFESVFYQTTDVLPKVDKDGFIVLEELNT